MFGFLFGLMVNASAEMASVGPANVGMASVGMAEIPDGVKGANGAQVANGVNAANGAATLAQDDPGLSYYVNPFIGTDGTGHTFPGATMPFGMVQLSPDTRVDGSWEGCSGYHYSDEYMYGFSHTHLSGTGVSDYGDVLVMPVREFQFHNGADGAPGYRARFSHENEVATAGYYSVLLDTLDVLAELTVTPRTGRHRYTFPEGAPQMLLIDLRHRDQVLDSGLMVEDPQATETSGQASPQDFEQDSEQDSAQSSQHISGHRISSAWAREQHVYFDGKFSRPYRNVTFLNDAQTGTEVAAIFEFDPAQGQVIELDLAISAVDREGARKNRLAEADGRTFDDIRLAARDAWNRELEKIHVETSNEDHKEIFYTAMYHAMIAPNLYSDVDDRYRGMDMQIHHQPNYYTVFSLWDTYRALHPLLTIIDQERTRDFVKTLLAKGREGDLLPIWDLASNYTGTMIGYHAVPVIADAWLKGIRGYDGQEALDLMIKSAMQDHLGLAAYRSFGYIPMEDESESASKTVEYAYDDWTIAKMAQSLGQNETADTFFRRSQYYKNHLDPDTRFIRARYRNQWFSPFDPYEVNFNYTEANAWQYLYAPHDITGKMQMMGGKQGLEQYLDELFTAETSTTGRQQVDITGLIGQYAHGNEPSHHMAYLYNFVNKPHKTQERVYQILTELHSTAPDGIPGNEDCGQMSAWYIFSSLGFYPVTPADNKYIIGTPLFDQAEIRLENGRRFVVRAEQPGGKDGEKDSSSGNGTGSANGSGSGSEIGSGTMKSSRVEARGATDRAIYIASASLNGQSLERSYLYHDEIMAGGELVFVMSHEPTVWATADSAVPVTSIPDEYHITPAPFIASGDVNFQDSTVVTLDVAGVVADIQAGEYTNPIKPEIFMRLLPGDGRLGDGKGAGQGTELPPFVPYTEPFTIFEPVTLEIYAEQNGEASFIIPTEFRKIDPTLRIALGTEYANQYNGGGDRALIDGARGTRDFRTGAWQGYQNVDLDAVISFSGANPGIDALPSTRTLREIRMQFLQDQRSWIFLPTELQVMVQAEDAPGDASWTVWQTVQVPQVEAYDTVSIEPFAISMPDYPVSAFRVVAKTVGDLPAWHIGASMDGKAWIFGDEIELVE